MGAWRTPSAQQKGVRIWQVLEFHFYQCSSCLSFGRCKIESKVIRKVKIKIVLLSFYLFPWQSSGIRGLIAFPAIMMQGLVLRSQQSLICESAVFLCLNCLGVQRESKVIGAGWGWQLPILPSDPAGGRDLQLASPAPCPCPVTQLSHGVFPALPLASSLMSLAIPERPLTGETQITVAFPSKVSTLLSQTWTGGLQ
jgi:hypothetical protein